MGCGTSTSAVKKENQNPPYINSGTTITASCSKMTIPDITKRRARIYSIRDRSVSTPEAMIHRLDMSQLYKYEMAYDMPLERELSKISPSTTSTLPTPTSGQFGSDKSSVIDEEECKAVIRIKSNKSSKNEIISPSTYLQSRTIRFCTQNIIYEYCKNAKILHTIDKKNLKIRRILYMDNDCLYTDIIMGYLTKVSEKVELYHNICDIMTSISHVNEESYPLLIMTELKVGENERAGFELLDFMMENKDKYNVIFIVLTKNYSHPDLKKYKAYEELQFLRILSKPINKDVFIETINILADIIY